MEYLIFSEDVMAGIREILRHYKPVDDPHFDRLRDLLEQSGTHFQEIIQTTPCNLPGQAVDCSLSKRAGWLRSEVIGPIRKLMQAVQPDMRIMFSTGPDHIVKTPKLEWEVLTKQLEQLGDFAAALHDDLTSQARSDAGHNMEIRYMIVEHITHALSIEVPTLKPSRGTHDPVHGWYGDYPAVIRAAFKAITGEPEKLDGIIEDFVNASKI